MSVSKNHFSHLENALQNLYIMIEKVWNRVVTIWFSLWHTPESLAQGRHGREGRQGLVLAQMLGFNTKQFWGRILDLAWLKFAMSALQLITAWQTTALYCDWLSCLVQTKEAPVGCACGKRSPQEALYCKPERKLNERNFRGFERACLASCYATQNQLDIMKSRATFFKNDTSYSKLSLG